ncbi:iron chelate uptake ABC transporter family permease subunit [Micrococcales bacterium 31B]|nr:iron chelate uptake ABC transporter family permease subunit [Micrococcales bacterium 31B]
MTATFTRRGPARRPDANASAPPPRRRNPLGLGAGLMVLAAALAAVAVLSLMVGARTIEPSVVLQSLTHYDPSNTDHIVVRESRLPRTVVGLLVGAALGLAGTIMQGVTRNPLADPGLLGVNAGASMFVVVSINFFGITSLTGYVWFAMLGAAVAACAVYAVASIGRGGATPLKLAIAGAAISAGLLSLITMVLLTSQATLDQFRFWQVGSLTGRTFAVVNQVLPFMVVGCVAALALGRMLNTLSLGDDVARGLGAKVERDRGIAGVILVVLCGAATAAAGPISFLGLTVPHSARAITGPNYHWTLPYAMLLCPAFLLAADVAGRVINPPGEVQVGIVTALLGAPIFMLLVRFKRMSEA